MTEEQFLLLLFIKNKGHRYTVKTLAKLFQLDDFTPLVRNKYIEPKIYGKVRRYYYITPLGKQLCDNITPVLNLI